MFVNDFASLPLNFQKKIFLNISNEVLPKLMNNEYITNLTLLYFKVYGIELVEYDIEYLESSYIYSIKITDKQVKFKSCVKSMLECSLISFAEYKMITNKLYHQEYDVAVDILKTNANTTMCVGTEDLDLLYFLEERFDEFLEWILECIVEEIEERKMELEENYDSLFELYEKDNNSEELFKSMFKKGEFDDEEITK